MNQTLFDTIENAPWKGNSSSENAAFGSVEGGPSKVLTTYVDLNRLAGNYLVHKRIINHSSTSFESLKPLYYIRFPKAPESDNANSSFGIAGSVSEYYGKIERQLAQLENNDDEDESIEKGAIQTALSVVGQLRCRKLAPPALSWHGGDAIVMLWALGDTTYAITVTDGEVGYVVRRNKKAIRSAHSISIDAFKLADLR